MPRRAMLRTAAAGLLAFAGLFTSVHQAYAGSYPPQTASTEGARASCFLGTQILAVPNEYVQIDCDLWDTKQDGDGVYVEWWRDGFAHYQLPNNKGNGHRVHVADNRLVSQETENAYFKVCRNVPFSSDNCSKTRHWRL
jgi:hypothetical protein